MATRRCLESPNLNPKGLLSSLKALRHHDVPTLATMVLVGASSQIFTYLLVVLENTPLGLERFGVGVLKAFPGRLACLRESWSKTQTNHMALSHLARCLFWDATNRSNKLVLTFVGSNSMLFMTSSLRSPWSLPNQLLNK